MITRAETTQTAPTAPQDAGTSPSGTALHATGVHRHFGSVRAVDGVDLSVDRGEIVALLGPNGAGKTTFLDMVLGFTEPTSGTLSVLGTSPQRAVRAGRVGAVLQTEGLLADLTVKETVSMVAACHPRYIPVDEALERAGAARIATRKVKKCSGGERQRLRFALALLTEPDLLLLDEPTAGMDVRARQEFWAAMHAEAERGRTVIFATHYLQEASDFADRIVLLRQGRVVVDGSVQEVTGTGQRTLSCRWIGPGTPQALAVAHGIPDDVTHQGDRVRFTTGDTDALARSILTDGLGEDLEIAAASLDQVFLDLTADTATETTTDTADSTEQKGR
ncbi:ABC transporter ATP-binding protein [Micrococcus terreus]|uniref:ABC-2 type transport system ATP-binding protein n=1 Tax=Micrococcus terreus TaxID=574650 RepID=A0A1I7MEE0_9MICC|nr:ABC transporter ATP-binding protein [Micrococcus terreus]SFV20291.1 ABC-2 type transport system ATP-binding protein [Micrococcus terreus]